MTVVIRPQHSAILCPLLFGIGMALVGCDDGGAPLERSCRGQAVPNCLPYEYSVVTEASLSPSGVMIDDPTAMVDVRVRLSNCGEDTPLGHEVAVRALAPSSSGLTDAGPRDSVFDLLSVRDDGETYGDTVAKDGLIEVTVPNPFVGPEALVNQDLVLRFMPAAPAQCSGGACIGGTCQGEVLEVPYRTGGRFTPMP